MQARDSWRIIYDMGVVPLWFNNPQRTSSLIRDSRNLPYLKDMLGYAVDSTSLNNDIILWCNDDVVLDPRIQDWCMTDVLVNQAMSMRRFEAEHPNDSHIGRELFAFTREWLVDNLPSIPDFLIGCPCFDIVLAAIIRNQKGIFSTLENMTEDFPDCDSTERFAIHEYHVSSWAGKNEFRFPGNNHNRTLARAWCRANMPSLNL